MNDQAKTERSNAADKARTDPNQAHAIDMALNIVRKNESLKSIIQYIDRLRADARFQSCYKELFELQQKIHHALRMDHEREVFQLIIREKNEYFYQQLARRFPNLTPNETRLCALIRLGLSAKETAEVLNISVKSVEMNRYRLRKKLKVAKSVSLNNFIKNI